jgi:nucleotide-binding universal stress UspA family protein
MRIVLALDGSVQSNHALDLVGGLPWPAGTEVRVVAVLERSPDLVSLPWPGSAVVDTSRLEETARSEIEEMLRGAGSRLAVPGRVVEWELVRGSPAAAIVAEARDFGADLVVLGSRGHGRLASMLLGSVSSQVVDHAPCPVLVVRGAAGPISRILLAEDGSAHAAAAAEIVASWTVFRDYPVDVVTVANLPAPWSSGLAPTMVAEALDAYAEALDAVRAEHNRLAAATVDRLHRAGLRASVVVREGDAATEIVEAAVELGAGVVVVGSRGVSGIARTLLGGVARSVLLHAPCSVLVVHR